MFSAYCESREVQEKELEKEKEKEKEKEQESQLPSISISSFVDLSVGKDNASEGKSS
jgi:hypothetical protein